MRGGVFLRRPQVLAAYFASFRPARQDDSVELLAEGVNDRLPTRLPARLERMPVQQTQ